MEVVLNVKIIILDILEMVLLKIVFILKVVMQLIPHYLIGEEHLFHILLILMHLLMLFKDVQLDIGLNLILLLMLLQLLVKQYLVTIIQYQIVNILNKL